MPTTLTVTPPSKCFDLHRAVCSYGYFILAPNHWLIDKKVLHRPLRTSAGRLVHTVIRQRKDGKLAIQCDRDVPRKDHDTLKQQVARMFRFGEDYRGWRKVHPQAKRRRFDRMFRSPSLFEDMVKTITSCNVTWRNTIVMNQRMVQHVGHGGFPTPEQLADFGEQRLKDLCRVGYRADRIIRLARMVADGDLDLDWFEAPAAERNSDEIYEGFLELHGFGPYAAANLCHLVGRYDKLAIDTETYRHFCLHYNVKRPKGDNAAGLKRLHAKIEKHYGQFAPYQFLAYWFELWEDYQTRYGPAWRWDRDTTGTQFTAAVLK
ncbi:endonuclease III domain-containing protein [Algisphaera agarilytica]|uniref:DNA-(apurinic or apyrimidinic site) lyase n=1 Tax=Algisphaera agarilytica TaxID=1385975 RepID=A0A7X0H6Q8_9BACT|nr:endonuclease III domain-containing protein [Algisphaera agarilytica]MBB6430153.1 3-methyladenine DNA glycosylase/8-oxoguanine DNA glycosylase [Algisphaera agarilytica]